VHHHGRKPARVAIGFTAPDYSLFACRRKRRPAGPIERAPRPLPDSDNPVMRALVRTMVEQFPVAIAEASDGKEAMKLIEADRTDLLLSDYQMPNWDGLTLCHHLHRQTDLKPIRTVLIAARSCRRTCWRPSTARWWMLRFPGRWMCRNCGNSSRCYLS
jgi:hypothetical protein